MMREHASAPERPDVSVEADDAAYATATSRGGEFIHPLTDEPWGVRRLLVRDAATPAWSSTSSATADCASAVALGRARAQVIGGHPQRMLFFSELS